MVPGRVLIAVVWVASASHLLADPPGRVAWDHRSSTTGAVPKPDVGRQVAALIADIDGDGVNDIVIASYEKMAWFKSPDWTRRVIEPGAAGVRLEAGGDVADLNGDGIVDIVMGAQSKRGEVWWWENPGKAGFDKPWKRHEVIAVGGTHHDQVLGDFDGDGRLDLAFWHNAGKRLYLARIPADPAQPWPVTEIAHLPGKDNPEGLVKIDIDGDGRVDLVGGGYWFKHAGGSRFEAHAIDADYRFTRTAAGDLIEGGRPEVLIGSGDGIGPLNLYQWKDGAWVRQTLIDRIDHGHTLQVADIDGDGHLDIYTAEMHTPGPGDACRQWILYGDGKGGFVRELLSTGAGSHESRLGDLNRDGRIDILQKDFQHRQRLDVWLNRKAPK